MPVSRSGSLGLGGLSDRRWKKVPSWRHQGRKI